MAKLSALFGRKPGEPIRRNGNGDHRGIESVADVGSALGVALVPRTGAFRAVAVGDCNLFLLRGIGPGLRLVRAFPLERSEEFGSSPFLLGSVARPDDDPSPHVRVTEGVLPGDGLLLLASDALSAWLLRREESRP